jgi:hypothetical protein
MPELWCTQTLSGTAELSLATQFRIQYNFSRVENDCGAQEGPFLLDRSFPVQYSGRSFFFRGEAIRDGGSTTEIVIIDGEIIGDTAVGTFSFELTTVDAFNDGTYTRITVQFELPRTLSP